MEREVFRQRLVLASTRTIEFNRTFVRQELRAEVRYILLPNRSCDLELHPDEVVYPLDSLAPGTVHGPWTLEEVVSFLWRDAHVPEWIDIHAIAERGGFTLLELRCCGRFTANDSLLYQLFGDTTPFNVQSPVLPRGWKEGEKFDLGFEC